MKPTVQIINGDCQLRLKSIPDQSIQCCVTSPPYFGLRDYNATGQIGLEKSPKEFVDKMVAVFSEVKRVLKDNGTLWLNLGDSYASAKGGSTPPTQTARGESSGQKSGYNPSRDSLSYGLKNKNLIGIPWKVAFALQEDGWYLRSDIIWNKPNCMPESVKDRPTRAHEYLFLLTKSERYYYDFDAIKEPCSESFLNDSRHKTGSTPNLEKVEFEKAKAQDNKGPHRMFDKQRGNSRRHAGFNDRWDNMTKEEQCSGMRNKRDVWTVAPASYREAHFATYPPDLIKPCILAGTKPGDTVLDPFGGSGTTGEVAIQMGRSAILIELNPDYIPLIEARTSQFGLPI